MKGLYKKFSEINDKSINYPAQKENSTTLTIENDIPLTSKFSIVPLCRSEIWRYDFTDEYYYYYNNGTFSNSVFDYSADGQIGFIYKISRQNFMLKSNFGTNTKRPSFSELFGDSGYITGNINLLPEKSCNSDLSLYYTQTGKNNFNKFYINSSVFYNYIYDIIIYVKNSRSSLRAQNISNAACYGSEFSTGSRFFNHIDLSGNFTYQMTVDKGDIPYYRNKLLPYRPVYESYFALSLFNNFAEAEYNCGLTGYNFRDRANSKVNFLNHRVIHNTHFRITTHEKFTALLEIKNFTDNRTTDIIGYHLPGRSLFLSITVKF